MSLLEIGENNMPTIVSASKLKKWRGEIEREYKFLRGESKSPGIGEIVAELFMP